MVKEVYLRKAKFIFNIQKSLNVIEHVDRKKLDGNINGCKKMCLTKVHD